MRKIIWCRSYGFYYKQEKGAVYRFFKGKWCLTSWLNLNQKEFNPRPLSSLEARLIGIL